MSLHEAQAPGATSTLIFQIISAGISTFPI
jgi:hypothetical protein